MLEYERELLAQVDAMGGKFSYKLDLSVNLLIVGKRFSGKYNYALQNNIKMISHEKFKQAYESWRAGSQLTPEQEIDSRLMGVFEGMSITLSNLDKDQKTGFHECITRGGGVASRTLCSSTSVLATPHAEGRKSAAAQNWRVPIVSINWIADSIKYGGALDLKWYNLLDPEAPMRPPFDLANKPEISVEAALPRQLKRRAGDGLVPTRNLKTIVPNKSRSRVVTPASESLVPQEIPDSFTPPGSSSLSELSSLNRKPSIQKPKLLQNMSFELHGFNEKQTHILNKSITSHGGSIAEIAEVCVVYSNHNVKIDDHPKVISEWAIERTLYYKQLKFDDFWSRPVYIKFVANLSGKDVSISGFEGIELNHIIKLLGIIGAKYQEVFNPNRDLLIVQNLQARKIMHAKKWGIPVVNLNELFSGLNTGSLDLAGETSVVYEDEENQAKQKFIESLGD